MGIDELGYEATTIKSFDSISLFITIENYYYNKIYKILDSFTESDNLWKKEEWKNYSC